MSSFPSLCQFLDACVTPYHTAAYCADLLRQAGYTELFESEPWHLTAGESYFFCHDDSAVVAFSIPKNQPKGIQLAAAHGDSPSFFIKKAVKDGRYTRLSVERYGGMLCDTWFDRPLSVAGRVMVRTEHGTEGRLVNWNKPVALIPSVAPHLIRDKNACVTHDPKTDLLPLYGVADSDFDADLASLLGVHPQDILAKELYLYSCIPAYTWGPQNAFITASRLDDLQCVWALLKGYLGAKQTDAIAVWTLFNHEEVGSGTTSGANSSMLSDVLTRMMGALSFTEEHKQILLANSYFVSADNAHAVHPNHPELSDALGDMCHPGQGIVIKRSASKSYTTDALSEALFVLLCQKVDAPLQYYTNRADLPGGSTLGALAVRHLPSCFIDIGLAQLAMHSAIETASSADAEHLASVMQIYFSSCLSRHGGQYSWK